MHGSLALLELRRERKIRPPALLPHGPDMFPSAAKYRKPA
jgi:hypothetical protein